MGKIFVDRGEVIRIARLFNCTDQAVRNALRGAVESDRAKGIRAEALRSGGVERKKRVRISREAV
jgi:hypothetical protein